MDISNSLLTVKNMQSDHDGKLLLHVNNSGLSNSDEEIPLQRAKMQSSLSIITDIAEEIYANQVKTSKNKLSIFDSENVVNILLTATSKKQKRPQTVPAFKSFQSCLSSKSSDAINIETDKREAINSIKNELMQLTETTKPVNRDRSKSAIITLNKHKNMKQGEISKHVCQVCGPEMCHLCAESNQRKLLSGQFKERKRKKSSTNQSVTSAQSKQANNETIKPTVQTSVTFIDEKFDSENAKLLAIVMKQKYGLKQNEAELETMIKNEKIFTLNRSSPYNMKRSSTRFTNATTTVPSSIGFDNNDDEIDIYNNDVYSKQETKFTQKTSSLQRFQEPVPNNIQTIDKTLKSLKRFNVTDYYFKNISDLRGKAYLKNEKLQLSSAPVPVSTNKLFLSIERFDIAEKYKEMNAKLKEKSYFQTKHSKSKSIQENKSTKEKDSFEKLKFVSLKKFHVMEPKFFNIYGPPLLQLKMQKFDEIYEKLNNNTALKIINRKNRL